MKQEEIKKNIINSQMRKAETNNNRAKDALNAAKKNPGAASGWGKNNITRKIKAVEAAYANLNLAEQDLIGSDIDKNELPPKTKRDPL